MGKNKSPAFQFYPDSWLSSPKIMLMTPAEEGAYIRLLCICWMNGHLPNDDEQLSQLSRLGEAWFNGGSEKIRKCFTERGPKLFNERLSKERGKQLKWRQKSREGGIKSGKLRNQKALEQKQTGKGGSEMVGDCNEPNGNQRATLQSSSSSSSLVNTYTLQEVKDSAFKIGLTDEQAEEWYHHFKAQGFKFANNQPIDDLSSALVRWRNNQYKFKKDKDERQTTQTGTGKRQQKGQSLRDLGATEQRPGEFVR